MIDAVRLTYAALRTGALGRDGELTVRGIEGESPRVVLGLDKDGRQHLLVESADAPPVETGVAAISTTNRDLVIGTDSRRYLDVVCTMTDLAEVFDHFVVAVLERAIVSDRDLTRVVTAVLDQWRSFFAHAGAPPARETLTSVVGELLLLRDVAILDVADVLSIWVGPRGSRHDFRRRGVAVEVKTTRAHTSRIVTIHGEDQLQPPDGGSLHLHFVRLEEVAGLGVCIVDLVDELVGLGVPRLALFDVLTDAGIPPAAFGTVGAIRFDVRERLTFAVDDTTPRIIPTTFTAGQRPVGIVDLTYRSDLDHVAQRALDATAYRDFLALLTADGPAA